MPSVESMNEFVAQASSVHGQLLVLVFLSAIMGLGKGGVPGFATVSTALVVATAPAHVSGGLGYSVSLMVPILSMIDVSAAWLHRHSLDWPTVWQILPLSFVGMLFGQTLDQYMTDRTARFLVGSILLSILVLRMDSNMLSSLMFLLPKSFATRLHKRKGKHPSLLPLSSPASSSSTLPINKTSKSQTFIWACIVGLFGGAATMLTNSMGPILNVYLLSVRKLSPESYIGTRAMFFCFLNLGKLPMRFAAGTLGWPMVPLAACLGMVAVLGVYFAKPIMLSMSEGMFVKLELLVVVLCGIKLLLL
mmetsp:Transcript_4268/g.11639  ORF Transcript_4268/g.11639 Transcript_4268/m.11639 type:complete len:305 (+) Transcript_4268:50-964(+)